MKIKDRELAALIDAWLGDDAAAKKEAGRAIARDLRHGPLSTSSQRMLADLFDPPNMGKPDALDTFQQMLADLFDRPDMGKLDLAGDTYLYWCKTGRKQKIKAGRPRKVDPRRLGDAVHQYVKAGHPKKRAYFNAAKDLGVSYRSAEAAYGRYMKPWISFAERLNLPITAI
jgi:hypothetical protein